MIDCIMSVHYFILYLPVLLLVYADSTYNQRLYYIQPTQRNSCPQSLVCMTLSQFADSINPGYYNESETNISLLFLPGHHNLDRELSLANLKTFSMTKEAQHNKSVTIKCSTKSAMFLISNSTYVSIKGLNFIDCGSITISVVEELVVEDSIFWGVEKIGTRLVLQTVSGASIVRSSFHYNTNFITSTYRTLEDICLERNATRQSGVLYTSSSNVTIINSSFTHNRAQIGGVLAAHNSSVYIC